jgi:signal transduction histidine kinase/CheY-like chemotaxis protein
MTEPARDRRRNHRLRALIAGSGEGSVACDETGKVVLMTEQAEAFLGKPRAKVAGKTFEALGVPEITSEMRAALAAGPDGPKERHVSFVLGEKTLECRIWRYEAPGQAGWMLTLRDDTVLMRQQERAEAILSSTVEGLVVFSPDNYVTYINPSAGEMLGVEPGDVVGTRRTIAELLGFEPPEVSEADPCWEITGCECGDCPQRGAQDPRCWLVSGTPGPKGEALTFSQKMSVCAACEVYQRNGRMFEESGLAGSREVTVSDPIRRVIKSGTSPVLDEAGNYIGCVVSLRDVTAERDMDLMKNEFVSTVSHELRTPMTSIKGYVELLLDGEAGELNEVQSEFLGIVKENSDRLVDLINELLDISRIESGRIHLTIQPLDMGELIAGAVGTFKTAIEGNGLTLAVDVPEKLPRVAGDRDRVGQVLNNLISNAIKYSPDGGTITVRVARDGREQRVSVTDTGIGIPREDREKIFTQFHRVDSSLARQVGGSGLGLAVSKKIINLLGGRIWVESAVGKGSTFSFTLPTAPRGMAGLQTLDGADKEAAGAPLGGGTILVVDRDPQVANLIEIYLAKKGYKVVKAHSGAEALKAATEQKPSAITLDVMLGEEDGFDLLQQLKEDPRTAAIPVVVLSVVCDEGKSLRLGAANYMEKPIEPERLIRVIGDLVASDVEIPRVLIVDDDRQMVAALAETLESRGFAADKAFDGLEAMAAVEARRPDLILLDLRMPKMDGYQVIEQVKRSATTKQIPIVVMTAYRLDHDKTDLLEMTVGQLAKPFKVERLASKVEKILAKERAR